MKRIALSLVLVAAAFLTTVPAHAKAREGNFGLGFILGSPTALSGKLFLGNDRALDAGLAFFEDDYILLYGDYLLHYPTMIRTESSFLNSLVPYFGVGPLIALGDNDNRNRRRQYFEDNNDDDFALGVRVPFGVEWMAPEIPIGVSLEIAPGIVVIPGTDGFVNAGLALRYYF